MFKDMEKKLIIAVDGYSSCGKSTFAKSIAKMLNYIFIDSGAMYRAVTLFSLRRKFIGNDLLDEQGLVSALNDIDIQFIFNPDTNESETYLNSENVEEEIRSIEVSSHVSRVSQVPEVRERLVELQRQIGSNRGIVMDGRDIGTVVFPEADIKIFMTASVDIRAERRFKELTAKGVPVDLEEVRRNIVARDIADENRDLSPLRKADDAIVLDNSRMSVDQQMTWIRKIIDARIDGN
jgi:CMP/dCMP kinase